MADGISFKMFTEPFTKAIAEREKRMPAAARAAVMEAGKVAQRAARKAAPVLQDRTVVSAGAYKRAYRQRRSGVSGPILGEGRPVRGLLRQSITPSRTPKHVGDSEYSLKVGPRGPRAHLYSKKIEARVAYMDAGQAAADAAMPAIARKMFNRVWTE